MLRRLMTSALIPSFARALGCLEGMGDHLAMGNDRDIATLEFNLALSDREEEVVRHSLVAHRERNAVHHLVLEEDDWVWITNCGLSELYE